MLREASHPTPTKNFQDQNVNYCWGGETVDLIFVKQLESYLAEIKAGTVNSLELCPPRFTYWSPSPGTQKQLYSNSPISEWVLFWECKSNFLISPTKLAKVPSWLTQLAICCRFYVWFWTSSAWNKDTALQDSGALLYRKVHRSTAAGGGCTHVTPELTHVIGHATARTHIWKLATWSFEVGTYCIWREGVLNGD